MRVNVREDMDELCDELDKIMEAPGFASTPEYEMAVAEMAFVLYSAVKYRVGNDS